MRLLAIALFALFAAAPLAFAQSETVNGPIAPSGGGSQTVPGPTVPNTQQSPQQTTTSNGKAITLANPLGEDANLQTLLNAILDFVIKIGTIVIVFMIMYVGFKFVVAQGAPGKIEEARKMLLWTVIGALILLGAKAIALGIQATVQALSVGQ